MNNNKPYIADEDIWTILKRNMAPWGDRISLQIKKEDGWQRLTFRQVTDSVEALAAYFHGLGLQRGDRVALVCENRPQWTLVFVGTVKLGLIIVPLDINLKSQELGYILKNCRPTVLVYSGRTSGLIQETLPLLTDQPRLIGVDPEQRSAAVESLDGALAKGRILLAKNPALPRPSVDDTASLVYTSGTTGIPKGVPLTHKNIASNVLAVKYHIDINERDRMISILPLQHTFATTGDCLVPLFFGAMQTFPETLKSTKLIGIMKEVRPTIILAVPLFFKILYDGIWREAESSPVKKAYFKLGFGLGGLIYDIFGLKAAAGFGRIFFKPLHKKFGDSIRYFVSGGAPLDPEVGRGFAILGIIIVQGYGLTESSPILTANNLPKNKMGSVGLPVPGVEVKIVDADERGYGEIFARGPNVFSGYWQNDEETKKMLRDGWLMTGDQGFIDKDGFLFITGRLKDIIVTGAGENVAPEEVENALSHSPFFQEICVFGKKARTGVKKGVEEVFAVVVPAQEYFADFAKKNGLALTDGFIKEKIKEEIDRLNNKLTTYKRVADLLVVKDELPRTPTKKIRRFMVKEKYADA